MKVEIVRNASKLAEMPTLKCAAAIDVDVFPEKLSELFIEKVKYALAHGLNSLLVDAASFVTDDMNATYIMSETICCADNLTDSGNVPADFCVYIAGVIADNDKFMQNQTGPRVINAYMNYAVTPDDGALHDGQSKEHTQKIASMSDTRKKKGKHDKYYWLDFSGSNCSLKTLEEAYYKYDKSLAKPDKFSEILSKLMDERNIDKDALFYSACGVGRQTYSNAKWDKTIPQRETVGAYCLGLGLTIEEAQRFYNAAGYFLGTSYPCDRVLRFCLERRVYDVDMANWILGIYTNRVFGTVLREETHDKK